jgi:hypothetical protein
MPTTANDNRSPIDNITRREASVKGTSSSPQETGVVARFLRGINRVVVHTPLSSPKLDVNSPSLSVNKDSLDEERRLSTRTSGSLRGSIVDDHGVDPLSLHILKRTGTEAQLKFRSSAPVPGEEGGTRSRQGSMSNHPEVIPNESAAAAGVKTIAHVGRGILGEVLGNESGHKKYVRP